MRLLTLSFLLPFFVFACATSPTTKPEPKPEPASAMGFDEAFAKPAATGLLVATVVPGSQADRAGMRPGDIVISYAGEATPDIQALNYAKNTSEKSVTIEVNRHGKVVAFKVKTGQIGIMLIPIAKGEGRTPLAAANVSDVDFAPLKEGERDDWFAFYQKGRKTGFARIRAQLLGDLVIVLTEEIYEDGETFLDHEVTSIVSMTDGIRVTCFRDRMNDWERFGFASGTTWSVLSRGPGSEDVPFDSYLPPGTKPAYMMETLAAGMPHRKGACFRLTPLFESSGRVTLESALVVAGQEQVEAGGKKVSAWRIEWKGLDGATNGTYWIGPTGRLERASFGDIHVERGTKEEVMAGQPESILAR